ncbi:MAG: hypothetical protein QGG36_20700 [Pirellulaceae bacterium]|jgi:hypothetical protein|nr:hypothetical protein [Pirellulaceae bacterium]MDP7018237.1 hypothetical protein [Pirellulaceae bacterium]
MENVGDRTWRFRWEEDTERVQRFSLWAADDPVSYADTVDLWSGDGSFRQAFSTHLADCPFVGFRWETPPVTSETVRRQFEFVLLPANGLERPVDTVSFADKLASGESVVAVENLSGDAMLVIPAPLAAATAYGHLAAFLRRAPAAQVDELWRVVGETMRGRLSRYPIWLSTAGMGVAWLHVRLDSRPKYYGYAPYRSQ